MTAPRDGGDPRRPRERTAPAGAEVRVFADERELAIAAAELVLASGRRACAQRGRFDLALAGGSTPRATYEELARRDGPDLERWHVWFGDERCVPPDDERSNHRMVAGTGLLARFPPAHVHRMLGEATDTGREAQRYERELVAALGLPPRLDLVHLGLGTDGHTASLFPGTPALESRSWVAVGRAPAPPRERLTLTLATLTEAREVVFLVSGAAKASTVARVLADPREESLPAARTRPGSGGLLWMLDRAAAAGLGPDDRGVPG